MKKWWRSYLLFNQQVITNSKYTAHTTSISAWKSPFLKNKTKTMKISSSLPPPCLFCLYATVPAGKAGEPPEHVKACSYRTDSLWEVRCLYCNTNHVNHSTSLSAKLIWKSNLWESWVIFFGKEKWEWEFYLGNAFNPSKWLSAILYL